MIAVAHSMKEVHQERIDLSKAKNIAEFLEKAYPGYGWAVTADSKNNMATVLAMRLSGDWGFYAHLDKIDVSGKFLLRNAGELLERYRVKRGAIDRDQVRNLKRDFAGNFEVEK